MPKGRGRGGARGKSNKRKPSPPTSDEHEEAPASHTSSVSSTESTAQEVAPPSQSQEPGHAAKAKKIKAQALVLSSAQEQDVADWYKEHEFLYNYRLQDYKNKEKKLRVQQEKADEVGATSTQLGTWIKSMRDRAGKITKELPSGSGAGPPLSDRDQWIKDNFGYIRHFMKRVGEGKRKKGGDLAKNLAAASGHGHPSGYVSSDTSGPPTRPPSRTPSTAPSSAPSRAHERPPSGGPCRAPSAAVSDIINRATDIGDLRQLVSTAPDAQGSRRSFSDVIYFASADMDDETFHDMQLALFPMVMQYQRNARDKRRQQQGAQQSPSYYHQQPGPSYQQPGALYHQQPGPSYHQQPGPSYQQAAPSYHQQPGPSYHQPGTAAPLYQTDVPSPLMPSPIGQAFNTSTPVGTPNPMPPPGPPGGTPDVSFTSLFMNENNNAPDNTDK